MAVRTPQRVVICHSSPEDEQVRNFSGATLEREMRSTDTGRGGNIFDLVWGRDYTERSAKAFADELKARVLVHGHEPCETCFQVPNAYQIIVDCSKRPAAYLTFSLKGPVTQQDLVDGIQTF